MANYKFPNFETVFENPTITMDGSVGTMIKKNIPEDYAFCDLLIETPQTKNSRFRLEGTPKPISWELVDLSLWVSDQLKKYEV